MAEPTLTIWKYVLLVTDEQTIFVPAGSVALDVQVQWEEISLWAYVNSKLPLTKYNVYVYGTGNPIPFRPRQEYIGTVQKGHFVWHVYWEEA